MKSQSEYTVCLRFKNLTSGKIQANSSFSFKTDSGMPKAEIKKNLMTYYRAKIKDVLFFLETVGVDNWDTSDHPLWEKVQKEIGSIKDMSKIVVTEIEEAPLGTKKQQEAKKIIEKQKSLKMKSLASHKNKEIKFPQTLTGKIISIKISFNRGKKVSAHGLVSLDKPAVVSFSPSYDNERVNVKKEPIVSFNDYNLMKNLKINENSINKPVVVTISKKKEPCGFAELEITEIKFK